MPHSLRRVALGNQERVVISKERYDAIEEAANGIKLAREIEHRFELVLANYHELEMAILDMTFRDMTNESVNTAWYRAERLKLNRRVLNLLTTFKMYCDHTKHLVSSMYGHDSAEVVATTKLMHAQYDSVLGYRVMEALRNSVQHRAMPIHIINYASAWLPEGEDVRGKLRYVVSLFLDVDQLAADGKFKRTVLTELRALKGKAELKTLNREHMMALGTIHNQLREMINAKVTAWIKVHEDAVKSWRRAKARGNTIGVAAVRDHKDGRFDGLVYLVEEDMNDIKYLRQKNRGLVNLPKRYVSSESPKRD